MGWFRNPLAAPRDRWREAVPVAPGSRIYPFHYADVLQARHPDWSGVYVHVRTIRWVRACRVKGFKL